MNFIEKLDLLKQKTRDTNASLARNSGIPYTTIDGLYKKGYANMKLSTLQALCDYFGVSIDYLAKDDEQDSTTAQVETEESKLLFLFRSLNAEGREALLEQAEMFASKEKYTDKANSSSQSENQAI